MKNDRGVATRRQNKPGGDSSSIIDMANEAYQKTQEEILKERAEVLGRAGMALSDVLEALQRLDRSIMGKLARLRSAADNHHPSRLHEINEEIVAYNRTRKQAQVRYYYLVVTREAMGLRKHKWVEEIYRIPPRKKPLASLQTRQSEEP